MPRFSNVAWKSMRSVGSMRMQRSNLVGSLEFLIAKFCNQSHSALLCPPPSAYIETHAPEQLDGEDAEHEEEQDQQRCQVSYCRDRSQQRPHEVL
eukprot:755677-Hanusia_phi.AAC.2